MRWEPSQRMIFALVTLLSTVALGFSTKTLLIPVLVGVLSYHVSSHLNLATVLLLSGAVALGNGISIAISIYRSSSYLLPSATATALVLSFYSILAALPPVLAITAASYLLTYFNLTHDWSSVTIPSFFFAAVNGGINRYSGVGRSIAWVSGSGGELGWTTYYFGSIILLDFLYCALGISMARIALDLTEAEDDVSGARYQDEPPVESSVQIKPSSRATTLSRYIIGLALLLITFSPSSISPTIDPIDRAQLHPSPIDPRFVYPALKVACVVPSVGEKQERRGLEAWLHESSIVASRGAKVILWSEGAVKLSKESGGDDAKEGWDAMGRQEQAMLRDVASVADKYKVFIATTYTLPSSSIPGKVYNMLTLVGPTLPSATAPHLIFSTTKHLPIPFIESYSHLSRFDASLASSSTLPIQRIELPAKSNTPSPHLTPLQTLDVSGSICFDIVDSSLFNSFVVPTDSTTTTTIRSPNLVLSAASSPSLFAPMLIENARSRARETGSYILHCDNPIEGGISALIDPYGDVLDLKSASNGATASWESEIDIDAAQSHSTVREWLIWVGLAGFIGIGLIIDRREVIRGRMRKVMARREEASLIEF